MSEWTPPEKLWAIFAHTNTDDYFILAVDRESKIRAGQYVRQEVVSYVPESVVDALREEVERLTRERDDLAIRADERRVQINERDAVISRLRAVLGQRGKDAADAEDALSRIHEHLTDAILLLSNRYKPTLTESLSMRAARAENELRAAFEVSDPIVGEPEPGGDDGAL